MKIELPETTSEQALLDLIKKLNSDPTVHGILVQMPLPKQIDEQKILLAIDPDKDADGFHPINVGKMITGDPNVIIPCTPLGVLKLLEAYNIETSGKHVVVLGRSNIVGRPLANLLSQKRAQGNATVTLAHSLTKDLPSLQTGRHPHRSPRKTPFHHERVHQARRRRHRYRHQQT